MAAILVDVRDGVRQWPRVDGPWCGDRPRDVTGASVAANLWPEPFSGPWNARVKDRLENRLHTLVCAGQLDLVEAQHAIAADWIAAYQRYVGGNETKGNSP